MFDNNQINIFRVNLKIAFIDRLRNVNDLAEAEKRITFPTHEITRQSSNYFWKIYFFVRVTSSETFSLLNPLQYLIRSFLRAFHVRPIC